MHDIVKNEQARQLAMPSGHESSKACNKLTTDSRLQMTS